MQAVIMAAGLGTRLRPHTLTTPKPMLEVAGRPILEWTLATLPASVDEVILVVNYLKKNIIEHFGNEWCGRRIVYAEQQDLKGTGHAIHACRGLLHGKFIVMNGDDLYAARDVEAVAAHDLAVLAHETQTPGRYGAFKTDTEGKVVDIIEGGEVQPGGLVNAGLYALDERFFDYPLVPIRDGAEFGLPQTLVTVTKDHPVTVVRASFWMPIGYPEDLAKATAILEARIA